MKLGVDDLLRRGVVYLHPYSITAAGKKQLAENRSRWAQMVAAIGGVLDAAQSWSLLQECFQNTNTALQPGEKMLKKGLRGC